MSGHSVGNGNKLQMLGYRGRGGRSSPRRSSFTSTELLAAVAQGMFAVLLRRDVVSAAMCGWCQHPCEHRLSLCLGAFGSELPRTVPAATCLGAAPAAAQPRVQHHLKRVSNALSMLPSELTGSQEPF